MSERYNKIFSLPENLYAQGAPIVIKAGALLRDNDSNWLIAQLKLHNISNKAIKVVKVELNLLDSMGRPVYSPITFDYLDLSAERGSDFGQKTPIKIAKSETRGFTAKVIEVGFGDGTIWQENESNWEQIPPQKAISSVFQNETAITGYKALFGNDAPRLFCEHKDLWCCTCGEINHESEKYCHKCNASLEKLESIGETELINEGIYTSACKKATGNNISEVKKAKEELSKIKDYKDSAILMENCNAKIKKRKKNKKLGWIIAGIIVLLGVLGFFVGYPLVSYSMGNYSVYIKMYNVKEFKIPEGETSIGDSAFSGCSSLTSITIPEGVTSIGFDAFHGCSSLTSITIPDSVTSIGSSAFSGCSSLTDITISESVTSIGNFTFYNCNSLTSINIPNNITSIGESAFSCSSLIDITIPNSVTNICDYAFSGCNNLTSVMIPNGVTSIGNYAFWNCSNLTNITIPNSVTSVGSDAFNMCPNLKFNLYDNAYYLGNDTNPYLVLVKAQHTSFTSSTTHEKTKFICNEAFSNCCGITNFIIPNGVTNIGYQTFWNCYKLKNIIIPKSVTNITYNAFESCRELNSVYYGGTTSDWANVSIGSNNTDLTSATIYYYSETQPTTAGNYWHYANGVPTAW